MHLGDVTLETVQPFVGTRFTLTLPSGETTEMKLEETFRYDLRQRRRKTVEKRAAFSMFFVGDPKVLLPQGMYTLRSDQLTLDGIFLVPVGQDDEATEYEAVFT